MHITFKGNARALACQSATEQKIYASGKPVGWMLLLRIDAAPQSEELDSMLADGGISKITMVTDQDERCFSGYTDIRSCVIRYNDTACTAELQLTKMNSEATEDTEEQENAAI